MDHASGDKLETLSKVVGIKSIAAPKTVMQQAERRKHHAAAARIYKVPTKLLQKDPPDSVCASFTESATQHSTEEREAARRAATGTKHQELLAAERERLETRVKAQRERW